jgi:hypothetical protein
LTTDPDPAEIMEGSGTLFPTTFFVIAC